MKKYILSLICLFVATISYSQNVLGSFLHGGITRTYTVYVPANYNVLNTHPIVFNLHGYTSNGTQQAGMTKMNLIADTAGFLVVYPEGTLDGSFQQYWNSGYGTSIDDVGFISALIDTLAVHYNVNLQRVYSTGMSNGGIMSNTLACELNHRIAAIAGVGGTMSVAQQGNCSPANKIPVMHIHGTADAVVAYGGSSLLLGVNALVTHWRGQNGLTTASTTTAVPNTNLFDASTAELIKYETGSAYPVYLYRVIGGGHSWPGSGVFVSGATNMDFDASLEIWKFFNQYSLITSVPEIQPKSQDWVKLTGANPVLSTLYWEVDELLGYNLKIYNILGVELFTKSFENHHTGKIDVGHLPQGAYVAVFSKEGRSSSFKFVKG